MTEQPDRTSAERPDVVRGARRGDLRCCTRSRSRPTPTDRCDGATAIKTWHVMPPHWECDARPRLRVTEPDHWFEPVADHLGRAYLRYSFTKGTDQEVAFLVDALGLQAGHAGARRRLRAGPPRPRARRAWASRSSASTSASASSTWPPRPRRRARRSSGPTPARWRSTPSSMPPSRSARAPSGSPAVPVPRSTATATVLAGHGPSAPPGGRARRVGLLGLLHAPLPRGPRHLRRRRRRQPRAHRRQGRGRHRGRGRPVDHLLHAPRAPAARGRSRASRCATSGRSRPAAYAAEPASIDTPELLLVADRP